MEVTLDRDAQSRKGDVREDHGFAEAGSFTFAFSSTSSRTATQRFHTVRSRKRGFKSCRICRQLAG